MKALLNELIDRSVEKKHPKLMLRRTGVSGGKIAHKLAVSVHVRISQGMYDISMLCAGTCIKISETIDYNW